MNLKYLYILMVGICSIVAGINNINVLGFNLSGLMWVVPFYLAIIIFFKCNGVIVYPIKIWLPWMVVVVVSTDWSVLSNWQRAIMLVSPLLLGALVSGFLKEPKYLNCFIHISQFLLLIYFLLVTYATVFRDPREFLHLRPGSMTACFLAVLIFSRIKSKKLKSLGLFSVAVLVIAILGSRGATVALLLAVLAGSYKIELFKRLTLFVILLGCFYLIFHTDAVQSRFFRGEKGTVVDLVEGRFDSSGRLHTWPIFFEEALKRPIFGHGTNSSMEFGEANFGVYWKHPHNEFIRIFFDQGLIGLLSWLFGMVCQYISLFRLRKIGSIFEEASIAGSIGIALIFFLAFSQNVLLYAAFINNLFFSFLGCFYGCLITVKKVKRNECSSCPQ